jgi:hypothetical protein
MQKTKYQIMSDAADLGFETREPDGQRELNDEAAGQE